MTEWTKEQQAANRAKWVAALRSGQYEQGTNYLSPDGLSYCCLGVACELAADIGVVRRLNDGYPVAYRDANTERDDMLPLSVQEWLGLASDNAATVATHRSDDPDDCGYNTLAELNDELDWNFNQIADLIEAGGVKLAGESS